MNSKDAQVFQEKGVPTVPWYSISWDMDKQVPRTISDTEKKLIATSQAHSHVGDFEKRAQICDPKLTFDGIRQCEQVRTVLNSNRNIRQIFCSPMTRAIETTLITFRDVMKFSMENSDIQTTAWDALRGMKVCIIHCSKNVDWFLFH